MGEMYGSMPYVATHAERMHRTVAAMTVDTPAAPYDLAGTEYTFYMNPHVAKSYVDAFVLHVAELYFPKVGRPWHWHEYMIGTDTYLAEPDGRGAHGMAVQRNRDRDPPQQRRHA